MGPDVGEVDSIGDSAVEEFDRVYGYLWKEIGKLKSLPTIGKPHSKKKGGISYRVSKDCWRGRCATVSASNDWLYLALNVRDEGDGLKVAKSPTMRIDFDSSLEDDAALSLYEMVASEMGGSYSGEAGWGKKRLPTIRTLGGDFGILLKGGTASIYTGLKGEKRTALEREFIRAVVNSGEALEISVGPYKAQG